MSRDETKGTLPATWKQAWTARTPATAGGAMPVATLRLPERFGAPGLLVGWSLELEHAKRPMGFVFGDPERSPASGYIDPILMEKEGHLITIAPTGAGKGVGCIIPALLRHEGPVIAIDPKGENVAITARRRRELGQQVVVLDPIGVTEQPGGAALNPLDLLDPGAATSVDEAAALASTMIDYRHDERNRFWYERASHLVTGVILHVVTDLPPEDRNLPMVRTVLGKAAGQSEKFFETMAESAHPEVRAIARSVNVGASETRESVIAVAQDAVDFLRGPLVQDATRRTTFDLRDVTRGAPLSIFIVLPPHMLESHGRLLRLWVTTLVMAITRRRGRAKQSTLFLLDEAAQLGTLPQLRQAITLLRGYGLRTWSFWQDFSQLRLLYPADWQTMVNNCQVLQCFGAFNALAAAEVAQITGFGTPTAVLDLDDREMILQISGDQPVIARVPNYRFDPPFTGLFDANPYFDPDQDVMPKTPPRIRLYERPAPPTPAPRPEVVLPPAPPPPPPAPEARDAEEDEEKPAPVAKTPPTDPFLRHLLESWPDGAATE